MNGTQIVASAFCISLLSACGGGGSETSTPLAPALTISTQTSIGGTILPTSASVASGQTATFTITAQEGFLLQQVSGCSGVLNGSTYITGAVQQNCLVTASFVAKKYQLTVTANTGGKVELANTDVAHGEQTKATIVPDAGYVLGHVDGCGGTLAGNIYTTAKITANCQIQVNFASPKWLVSTATNWREYGQAGGSVIPKEKLVSQQSSTSFQIEPLSGFSVKSVDGCTGTIVRNGHKATFTTDPIRSACTAFVQFTRRPVAAGTVPPRVKLGNVIKLDAAASSDAEAELLTYVWTLSKSPNGSQAKLENADQAIADFVPDLAGHYQFALVVNDGSGDSMPVTFDIHVTSENTAPIPLVFYTKLNTVGSKITVDASKSYDIDGDSIQFSWKLLKQGQIFLNADNTNKFEWLPEETGSFMLQLRLTDSQGNVGADNFVLIVNEQLPVEHLPPVARIQNIPEAATQDIVWLDARASTGEAGKTLSYKWSLVTKPEQSVVNLQDAEKPLASFMPDMEGTYIFKVSISDGTLTDDESVAVNVRDTSIRLLYEREGVLIELLMPFRDAPVSRVIDEENKTIDFGKYYLVSKGKDFVIENVEATEDGNDAKAYFYGLYSGLIIPAGTVHAFSPRASLVRGVPLELQYKFRIKETNKTVLFESYFKLP